MGRLLIVYEKEKKSRYSELIKLLIALWQKKYSHAAGSEELLVVEELVIEKGSTANAVVRGLKGAEADYIVTLDMAGFEAWTLLGGCLYNILRAKQLHIVSDRRYLSTYANQDMALNLFFFVAGETESLQAEYEQVLNIEGLPRIDWRSSEELIANQELLEHMIDVVME